MRKKRYVLLQGDSGGPVACQSSTNDRWYLQGDASTVGFFSCKRHSIYANVAKHLDWIRDVIAENGIYT